MAYTRFPKWEYSNYTLGTVATTTTTTYPAYPSYTYGGQTNHPEKKDTILDWLEKEVEKICSLSRQAA